MEDSIVIVSAKVQGNLCVELTFSDGHKNIVDIGDFIRRHPHPQYNKYLDPDMFRTFKIVEGNIVWGEDWDLIFPIENLYSGKDV
jgi:hypothetical protein